MHVVVVSKKGISELSLNSAADLFQPVWDSLILNGKKSDEPKYFMPALLKLRQKKKNRNLSRRRGIYYPWNLWSPHDLQNNNTFNE